MTGAAGAAIGIHVLSTLRRLNVKTHLIISKWAAETIKYETDYTPATVRALADHVYNHSDLAAPIASGSFHLDGMIVVPCSVKALAAINAGICNDLITRAADFCLKERRRLVLSLRETPFSEIHLRNMMEVTRAGAIIAPPVVGFYTRPSSVEDILDQMVGRLLDLFGLEAGNFERWDGMANGKQNGKHEMNFLKSSVHAQLIHAPPTLHHHHSHVTTSHREKHPLLFLQRAGDQVGLVDRDSSPRAPRQRARSETQPSLCSRIKFRIVPIERSRCVLRWNNRDLQKGLGLGSQIFWCPSTVLADFRETNRSPVVETGHLCSCLGVDGAKGMSSSTSPCLDVDETTPAVVEWEHDDTTHCFSKPDPKIDSVMLRIRLEGSCALFELRFPMNLKGVEGISAVAISIDPSSITSFDFAFASTAPGAVQEKFKSSVACLRLQLNKTVRLIVPASVKEPLAPSRTQSGKVMDALRMLSGVTSFAIYIEAAKLSKAELQTISNAVKKAYLTSFHNEKDRASTYHGTEAKVVDLSPKEDAPPAYDETEPPPPAPPINERKRRRVGSQDEARHELSEIWAELKARDEKARLVDQELSALRQENKTLRDDLNQLRQQVTTFRNDFTTLQRDVEQLQGQDTHNTDVLEGYDTRLVELRDDLEDLDAKVDSIQEHRDENGVAQSFLDRVRSDVYDDIVTRLTS
ncbi:hypothetical protein F53441_6476 [Fusarium austroafricanum]|uniref:Flavin prenyltransferase PAD1, mitochondrial n=1 Tax=Fusarium austroafricanum TaxID=2364996 RepID=A0A8H4KFN6_9HYPO|nr:hypothetical protein F53441_6476 [Fusarium austroafricanum]